MKTRIMFTLLLISALFTLSCEKELKEVVYSNLTEENAFTTSENAQAAVNSLYAPLHNLYREPVFYINDIASDAGFKDGNCFEVMNDVAIYNDNRTVNTWDGFYQVATRANVVIDQVPQMRDNLFQNGISKEQLLAEAYFMRAFAYYNLTDIFFQVPLITDSKVNSAEKAPYAPIDKIETRIENDLFYAKENLPKQYGSLLDAGRPTYGAACGLLARLYMRQAGRARQEASADERQLWKDALTEINNVLALEPQYYTLQPKVWNVFDPTNEAAIYNNELIFAIRASGNITSGSWDLGLQFTGWEYDMGWGNMYQPLEMTWKFDPDDERLTVLQVTEYEDIYVPDETYFIAPPSVDRTGSMNQEHTINGKTYALISELGETYTQKYKFLNTWKYIYDTPNNLPVMRLADFILCKAEVLNEINGPCQEAIDAINRIRERAFGDAAHNLVLGNYATKEDLRSAICDERLYELNMECLRRPDLIRMGLWKDRMQKYIKTIQKRYAYKAANEGQVEGYYDGAWAAYPDPSSLTDGDVRRYMPIPYREVTLNPTLQDSRAASTDVVVTTPDVPDNWEDGPAVDPGTGGDVTWKEIRWDFDNATGWTYYTHNPEQDKQYYEVKDGYLYITTKGNTYDRNKMEYMGATYGEGEYTWRINIPEIEPHAQVSVAGFIYKDDAHELDFEIGYGKEDARQSCGAGAGDLVACMTNQQSPHHSTYTPIKPGWHTCTIKMEVEDGNYKATWIIDDDVKKTVALGFGPSTKFVVICSVENLKFLGDNQPTQDHTAAFDWVSVKYPEKK